MSYRRHGNSKGARQAHHRRERARRRKLREKGGQVEPFGYVDTRGADRAELRRMSVSKGARDGAPALFTPDHGAKRQDRETGLGRRQEPDNVQKGEQ